MKVRDVGATAIVAVSLGLVATGCSGTPASQSQSTPVATFTARLPSASTLQLTKDATVLTDRLRTLGDGRASVVVRGRTVEVMGGGRLPVSDEDLTAPGTFQVRPVLCGAGPSTGSAPTTPPGAWPTSCSASRYSLQPPNLTVDVASGGSNLGNIEPDPALSSYASSTPAYDDSHPDDSVLVPLSGGGSGGDGVTRFLLGPAVLNSSAVAHASAASQYQWTVDVTFTPAGATVWDAVARRYFHEMIGIDVDGRVLSVPLMQPSQATFTTFDGKMQVSDNFTRRSAEQLAAILDSGPLATPLSG